MFVVNEVAKCFLVHIELTHSPNEEIEYGCIDWETSRFDRLEKGEEFSGSVADQEGVHDDRSKSKSRSRRDVACRSRRGRSVARQLVEGVELLEECDKELIVDSRGFVGDRLE